MAWLFVLLVVAVVVWFAVERFGLPRASQPGQAGRESTDAFAYERQGPLFSPAERSFYGVLQWALGEQYVVLGKVRVADVLTPQHGLSNSARQTALGEIQTEHFDFVLCRRDHFDVEIVIELDDSTHHRPNRQARDRLLEQASASAGLRLVRFPAQETYSVREVREAIFQPAQSVAVRATSAAPPPSLVELNNAFSTGDQHATEHEHSWRL